MNHELPDVQSEFIKDRGTRDQIASIHWIIKKAREFQKNIYFRFIDYTEEVVVPTNFKLLTTHITHLEPDILECEVKQVLGSITTNKASGGDGIPVELLQILKDEAVKVLHSICQQISKTQQWPWDWKGSVFIPIPKKDNAKECSNYRTIALISHTSKVMLKILQARLQLCKP